MLRTLSAGILIAAAGLCQADALSDALESPDRPAADRQRDATSRPAAVLRFIGIPAGGVAVDLFAGGGYYSEILARAMGAEGRVYLHNNAAYLGFAEDEIEERLKGNRLPNVIRYDKELDAVDLAEDSVDLVLMVLSYHDLYYKTEGWDQDPDSFFAMVHRILKPGGVLAVVDHVAATGTGASAAQELHRIDPAFAKADIEGRGFELVGELSVLRNDTDPLNVSVFDDSVRRKTSRFAYRFIESR